MLLADAEEELLFSQDRLFLYTLSNADCILLSIIHKCIVYSTQQRRVLLYTRTCACSTLLSIEKPQPLYAQ